jgi:hypothetical protein
MMRRRFVAHILQEVRKRQFPSFADSDSTRAIILVGITSRTFTSLDHRRPRSIFCRSTTRSVVSMLGCLFKSITPARFCMSIFDSTRKSHCCFSTFTKTFPPARSYVFMVSKNGKHPEFSTNKSCCII